MGSMHFITVAVVYSLYVGQCIAAPGGLLGNLPLVGGLVEHLPVVGDLLGGSNGVEGLVDGIVGHIPVVGDLLGGQHGNVGLVDGIEGLIHNLPIVGGLLGGENGGLLGGILTTVEEIPDHILHPVLKGLIQPVVELGGKSILGVLFSGIVGDTVNAAGIPLAEATGLIRDALSGDVHGLTKDVQNLSLKWKCLYVPHLLSITEYIPHIIGDIGKIPQGMQKAGEFMDTMQELGAQKSVNPLDMVFEKLGVPADQIDAIKAKLQDIGNQLITNPVQTDTVSYEDDDESGDDAPQEYQVIQEY